MNFAAENFFKNVVMKKLGNKYHYIGHIGGGRFSDVYRVKHKYLDEEHALKIMDSDFILKQLDKERAEISIRKYEKIKLRFIREAQIYSRLTHPGIAKIYDIDVVTGNNQKIEIPYLIMKYINGTSLETIIKNESPLQLKRILTLSEQILEALAVIHRNNIVHRDLNPGNIMINRKGRVILIDFCLAKDLLSDTKLTSTGKNIGGPFYLTPEHFAGSSKLEYRSDIYLFGLVLFEMITGRRPFAGKSMFEIMMAHCNKPVPDVREINPDLPKGIEDIIKKALAKKPEDRFLNAEEMIREMRNVMKVEYK